MALLEQRLQLTLLQELLPWLPWVSDQPAPGLAGGCCNHHKLDGCSQYYKGGGCSWCPPLADDTLLTPILGIIYESPWAGCSKSCLFLSALSYGALCGVRPSRVVQRGLTGLG